MKHGIKKTACLILSALALEALCACSGGEINTDAPVGTDSPATSQAATEEITSEEPVTQIEIILTPEDPRLFNILFSEDANKADMSVGADGSTPENIAAAEAAMLGRYGVTLNKKLSPTVADDIRTGVLSGTDGCTAVHLGLSECVPLMLAGMLQNLSDGGIGINTETLGVNRQLTSAFMFGNRTYAVFCNCLTSSLGEAFVLSADCSAESVKTAVLAASQLCTASCFTLEEYLKLEAGMAGDKGKEKSAAVDDSGLIAMLTSLGGQVFRKDENGLPAADVKSPEFSAAYEGALRMKAACGRTPALSLSPVRSSSPERVILPLPKLSADKAYITFVDVKNCSVIAAPYGLAGGSDIAQYVSILGVCADGTVYAPVVAALNEKSPLPADTAAKIADIITGSRSADTSLVYGWAGLGEFVLSGLAVGTPVASLLNDRNLDSRIKTAGTAASIYSQRMK